LRDALTFRYGTGVGEFLFRVTKVRNKIREKTNMLLTLHERGTPKSTADTANGRASSRKAVRGMVFGVGRYLG
jgi:hypothetical protein